MKYTIEQATKTERFLKISEVHNGQPIVHIYRYDNKQLLFVATVFPGNDGFNPILFQDEIPFKNVKTIKSAINLLKKYDLKIDSNRKLGILSNNEAYKLLCQ